MPPRSTTMSRSTRANPPREINWLFVDPSNEFSKVQFKTISGHSLDFRVSELDWAAELKRFFKFRAREDSISIWKPNEQLIGHNVRHNWISTTGDIRDVAEICQSITTVRRALGESWDLEHVHFLITAKGSVVEDEDLTTAAEAEDTVPELPLQAMNRRRDAAKRATRLAPSKVARSKDFITLQSNSKTAIYNGSFALEGPGHPKIETIAPPIQIFHPVFQELLDRINDPEFEPDEEVVTSALDFLPHSSQIFASEKEALTVIRHHLTNLLQGYVSQTISTDSRTPDGVILRREENCEIPLILFEYKRSMGEGGCDPSVQAACSLREFLYKSELSELLDMSCCPSFLLAGAGSYLSIYGAVHTDKFIVQHLTDIHLGMSTTHEDPRTYHIAKVFTSLKRALRTLDTYYGDIRKSLAVPTTPTTPVDQSLIPRRCFFPYPTKFKEYQLEADAETEFTEFEYVDVPSADPPNVTFFAKSSDREFVVKFVDRYSVEAHDLLAEEEMAPRLLYYGSLDGEMDVRKRARGRLECGLYLGPLRMVVMVRLRCEEREAWPEDAREQVKKALDKLHENQLVFGDLRAPNVLLSGGKAFLIDFDWSGKVGEARYPRGLSRTIKWPDNVEVLERQLITTEHDLWMLDKLFSETVST